MPREGILRSRASLNDVLANAGKARSPEIKIAPSVLAADFAQLAPKWARRSGPEPTGYTST